MCVCWRLMSDALVRPLPDDAEPLIGKCDRCGCVDGTVGTTCAMSSDTATCGGTFRKILPDDAPSNASPEQGDELNTRYQNKW